MLTYLYVNVCLHTHTSTHIDTKTHTKEYGVLCLVLLSEKPKFSAQSFKRELKKILQKSMNLPIGNLQNSQLLNYIFGTVGSPK